MAIKSVNELKDDYCNHKWDSDAQVRLCFRCGQVRMFPSGDSNPRVLWPGRETKDDPLQLPKADKSLIAHVAKRCGIKKAVKATGIQMNILRGWQGAYCRDPDKCRQTWERKREAEREAKREAKRQSQEPPEELPLLEAQLRPASIIKKRGKYVVYEF